LRCSHPLSSSQTPTHNPPHTRPDTTTPAPQPKHPAQHETPKPDKDKDSCYGTTAGPDLQRQHPPADTTRPAASSGGTGRPIPEPAPSGPNSAPTPHPHPAHPPTRRQDTRVRVRDVCDVPLTSTPRAPRVRRRTTGANAP